MDAIFEELRAAGQAADDKLFAGDRPRTRADVSATPREQSMAELMKSMSASSEVEATCKRILGALEGRPGAAADYLAGKATLTLLLRHVRSGNSDEAHEIWTSSPPDATARGIAAIEALGAEDRDMMSYLCLSSWLQSLGTDTEAAALAVCSYMARVTRYVREHEPDFVQQALSNWIQFLEGIFGQPQRRGDVILLHVGFEHIPARWLVHFKQAAEESGADDIPILMYRYLRPSPWVLP